MDYLSRENAYTFAMAARMSELLDADLVIVVPGYLIRRDDSGRETWDQQMEYLMGVFSTALRGLKDDVKVGKFLDIDFAKRWPVLHQFLVADVDDDGKPRQTSTLLILVESAQVKGCLKDRDHDVSLWKSSSSILGVFTALEEGLTAESVEWRQPYKPTHRR
jgi:hypothetical protein